MKALAAIVLLAATPAVAQTAPAAAADTAHAADRYFDPAAMAAARGRMSHEHGGDGYSMALANILERDLGSGADGYRWEAEGSFGGDIHRLVIKTQGEGDDRDGVRAAEVQALYSRAVGPSFNLQAGVRQDLRPQPSRTYAAVGFEGLAPYWIELTGAVYLSNKGELAGRLEGLYDLRVTQRLILQPRAELNLAAGRDDPAGSNAELGLRLRYEVVRAFAPYMGVSYSQDFGAADPTRKGERRAQTRFVAGIRTWF